MLAVTRLNPISTRIPILVKKLLLAQAELAEVAVAAIKKITPLLAAASGSLLANNAGAQTDNVYENDWNVDFSYLYYGEEDRVTVNKLAADVSGRLSDDDTVNLKLVLDSMTGSTPTGEVVPGDGSAVTTTGTSGGSITTSGSAAGLANFDDTRLSADGRWQHSHSRTLRVSYGGYFSVESDYDAIGASASLEKDNADKTFTWTAGIGGSSDKVSQTGGTTPEPLALITSAGTFGEGKRSTVDLIGGFTKILNARTVMQFNLGYSSSSGYLTDPYKLVSSTAGNTNAVTTVPRYEKRPGERKRTHLYWKVIHHTAKNNTVQLAARYYSDDWDVKSFTFDYKHRLNKFNGNYWEPQIRLYKQSEASFYVRSLEVGADLPEFASADARLAESLTLTLAAKYGIRFSESRNLNMRLAYMHQDIENNNFEDNKALIFNINYSMKFD